MSQNQEQMIDWKYMRTYDILVAEYQFVGYENSVWIVTYCKDIELFLISKSINQPYMQKIINKNSMVKWLFLL